MTSLLLLVLGVLLVVIALVAMLVALGLISQSSKAVRERLTSGRPVVKKVDSNEPKIVISTEEPKKGFGRILTTAKTYAKIERNVLLAGRPDGWSAARVAAYKVAGVIFGVVILAITVSGNPTKLSWLMGIMAIGVGYFSPDVLIQKRAEARQHSIQQELPDVLDQVSISIESGLGFESAFARIGERRAGPLAEEIVRTVQDMRLGMSRRDAYTAMAERTEVDDLRRFVKSIVQAEQFGVSIAQVVRTQASEIRFKRRKRAEATALKVPVKIVFPLMACILPVLFIVILTPAVLNIGKTIG